MQRSSEVIASSLFRSILNNSNRRHGVSRSYHPSRSLFHLSKVETLVSVLAEVQLRVDALKSKMMILRLQQRLPLVLPSIYLSQMH